MQTTVCDRCDKRINGNPPLQLGHHCDFGFYDFCWECAKDFERFLHPARSVTAEDLPIFATEPPPEYERSEPCPVHGEPAPEHREGDDVEGDSDV